MAKLKLGDLLMRAGLIDDLQLRSGLAHQKRWGGRLGDILVEQGFLEEEMLWRGLSKQLNVPLVSLRDHVADPAAQSLLPYDKALEHQVFPLRANDRELRIATADPQDLTAQDAIRFAINRRLHVVLAPHRQIEWALETFYRKQERPFPEFKKQQALPSQEGMPLRDEDWNDVESKGAHLRPSVTTKPGPDTRVERLSAESGRMNLPTNAVHSASHPGREPASSSGPGTDLSALIDMQQRAEDLQQQLQHAPRPPSISMLEITRIETELRQTTRFLRLIVDACVDRGLFTREEYLNIVRG